MRRPNPHSICSIELHKPQFKEEQLLIDQKSEQYFEQYFAQSELIQRPQKKEQILGYLEPYTPQKKHLLRYENLQTEVKQKQCGHQTIIKKKDLLIQRLTKEVAFLSKKHNSKHDSKQSTKKQIKQQQINITQSYFQQKFLLQHQKEMYQSLKKQQFLQQNNLTLFVDLKQKNEIIDKLNKEYITETSNLKQLIKQLKQDIERQKQQLQRQKNIYQQYIFEIEQKCQRYKIKLIQIKKQNKQLVSIIQNNLKKQKREIKNIQKLRKSITISQKIQR